MPPTFNKAAKAFLHRFMDELDRKEAFELSVLANGYSTVVTNLEDSINALSLIEAKSINQLFLDKRFKQFLIQAQTQFSIYANDSGSIIETLQRQYAEAGLSTTQGLLTTLTREFNLLPVDAINNIIGFTAEGSPLSEVLIKRYGDRFPEVAKVLISSTAEGLNPRETTRLIGETLEGSLSDTLRIARTEQMRAFREASIMQMQESGVVDSWEWITEPNACDFCQEQEGKLFPLDESMDTHPNCRCIQAPHINT